MRSRIVDKKTAAAFVAILLIIATVASIISSRIPQKTKPAMASSFSMGVGQVYSYPSEKEKHIKFKSHDTNIVTVDENGVITAIATGSTVIEAGKSKINVVVCDAPKSISFPEKEFAIGLEESYYLSPDIPDVDYLIGLDYESSDSNILNIDDLGKITGVAEGIVTVSVSTYNGCTDSCKIIVAKAPNEIYYSSDNMRLYKGSNYKLRPDVPSGYASKNITLSSDNSDVAKIEDDGTVTAVAEGTANITATSFNGKTAVCSVSVSSIPAYIRTDLDPSRPMIAFTFDDGPNSDTTNAILDVLEEYNGSATFFMVGTRVDSSSNEQCVKRMVSLGCQLGNHTYDHRHYGDEVTADDINRCIDTISRTTGQKPSAFRPTGGYLSDVVIQNCDAPIFIWNVDTKDWKHRNSDKISETIMSSVGDGDIVLMHDIYSTTATAVEKAVPELVKEGYQIVNVAELAYYKGVELENGKVYYSF